MPRTSRDMSIWMREHAEAKAQPPGMTSYGWGGGPQYSDAFRFRRAPSLPMLAEAYKSLIFTCVRLNSDAVTRVPLRLFRIAQSKGDKALRCDARGVSKAVRHRLKALSHTSKAMAGAEEVEEITGDFPLLKLLTDANPSMDRDQLINYTVMSMDVVGTAFWWPTEFTLGGPSELWPLPPHLVYPIMTGQGLVPDAYQFGAVQYRPEDLLIFKHLSMKNPYGLGMSPTQAAIEYARLEDTFVSIQDDLLSNGPRPSVVVSHKDPKGAFGPAERQRLEDDMNRKGRGGRAGGAFVVDGPVAVTPISWSPADLGAVEISKYDLERTCGCFGVPVSMVTNESSNMAVAREGLEQHARNAVEPRCKSIASTLTRWTHALDRGGKRNWHKLFWAFDPCVPEDKVAEAEHHRKYFEMGLPPDVILTEAGYDKIEGGDVSFVASGVQTLENAVKPPEPPPMPGQKPGGEDEPDDEPPGGGGQDAESKSFDAKAQSPTVPTSDAILSAALEATGYRDAWEAGELDADQHIELLHAVRAEGRRWLREEAISTLAAAGVLESKALFGEARSAVKGFFKRASGYVRELFVAGVFAVAGPQPLTAVEMRALDAEVADQKSYLRTFEREIVAENKPLDGTFVARAEQYGSSVWGASQEILRVGAKAAASYTREKRLHRGTDKPCPVCVEEEGKGWRPIGTLRKIGDSPCKCNCHCVFIFGDEASAKSFEVIDKRFVPCRDHRGRFASCNGAAPGTRHPKPTGGDAAKPAAGGGKKPKKKPGKKPSTPKKPADKKPDKKPATKPKEPAKPAAKPAKEKPAAAAEKPPKAPKESKPKPDSSKPAKQTDAQHHAEMRKRVDGEIDRLKNEISKAKGGRLLELRDNLHRFEDWRHESAANPRLIPPFEMAERLKIYNERGGAEKVAALQNLGSKSQADVARAAEIEQAKVALRAELYSLPRTSPRLEEVSAKLKQANDEHDAILKRMGDRGGDPDAIAAIINPGKTVELKHDANAKISYAGDPEATWEISPATKEIQPSVDASLNYLGKVMSDAGLGPISVPVGVARSGRAFHADGQIGIATSSQPHVVVHEFAHLLEARYPGINRSAQAFLKHRVGDEVPTQLAKKFPGVGYRSNEFGRRDNFEPAFGEQAAYYVGKDYGRDSSEVTSMGLEMMYNDPKRFAKNDPEHAAFILGILDGSLR